VCVYKVLMAALGGVHTAVVMEEGDMWTWGYGEDGALGHPKPYRPCFRDFSEKEKFSR
jgi:alpha-tubulin suppressor-like RCC1 family protein